MLEAVRTAYQGDTVGQTYRGNAVFNVLVILDARVRDRLSAVGDLPLRAPGGRYVRRCWRRCAQPTRATRSVRPIAATPCSTCW
ncbi:hypothetical protein CTI14_65070 [Methylobacterium radiotolerans]|nr:hypothetical protein CTI14_65070 [Methylobacterium radiotolerans]